uniref:Lectin n=1 Tax=Typhonium divaricatum TaxID=239688 RepID=Q6V8L5_9ARAE|nr:lectin precursor [Typhonium divaricatum]
MAPPAKRSLPALALLLLVILGALSGPSMAVDRGSTLNSNASLNTGDYLSVKAYKFIMQEDCNLVLYDAGTAIWSSGTYGRGYGCRCTMQDDGNLVVYNSRSEAVWSSRTYRAKGFYILVLQGDRNVVIYSRGAAIWSTGTYVRGAKPAVIIDDAVLGGRKANPAGAVAGGGKATASGAVAGVEATSAGAVAGEGSNN